MTMQRLRELLEQVSPGANGIAEDLNLYDYGILDSISTVAFAQDIEKDLDIIFSYDDLTESNFETLQNISKLLQSRYC